MKTKKKKYRRFKQINADKIKKENVWIRIFRIKRERFPRRFPVNYELKITNYELREEQDFLAKVRSSQG